MSFEFQKQKNQEGKDLRPPRSLTLTFAETNPWEMLVRDRLAALPRGYLKRVLLLLLEGSGMDLANEAVFQDQVEKLLLTKNLAAALGSGGASRSFSGASSKLSLSTKADDEMPAAPAITNITSLANVEPDSGDTSLEHVQNIDQVERLEHAAQRSAQPAVALPASKRQPQQSFKDGGFGALEL